MNRDEILDELTKFYLHSHDFNGTPVSTLVKAHGEMRVRECISSLLDDELISVVFGDYHPNPHVKALPAEPVEEQRKKLDSPKFLHACAYPANKHLKTVVDPTKFSDRPFTLCLSLGQAQLDHKAFDLSVLELYRNDQRYAYEYDDIHGYISIEDQFYRKSDMKESDKVLLESFGFAYDASVFPIKNFLYGFPSAPSEPFFPIIRGRQLKLLEVPVPILRLGPGRIAYSGGVFFNFWPYPVIRRMVNRQTRQGKTSLFYFHPWDLWKRSPQQNRQLKAHWVSLHLGDTLQKFEKLLDTYPLGSISANLEAIRDRARPVRIGGPLK